MRWFVLGYDPYHLGEHRRAVVAALTEEEAVRLLLERLLRPLAEMHRHDAQGRIMASLSVLGEIRPSERPGVLYSD